MKKTDFYRNARTDLPGPLSGVRVLEATTTWAGPIRGAGLPIAPVNTFPQAAQDPHVLERDMLQHTTLPNGETAPITGPAVKFSRTPTRVRSSAPEIGQHNAEILESIGLDAETQQAFIESGVIGVAGQ